MCFGKKVFLKILVFLKIHRKTPVPESLFFRPQSATLLKNRLWRKCFLAQVFTEYLPWPLLSQ